MLMMATSLSACVTGGMMNPDCEGAYEDGMHHHDGEMTDCDRSSDDSEDGEHEGMMGSEDEEHEDMMESDDRDEEEYSNKHKKKKHHDDEEDDD
jgi:hypothetical protein